MVPVVSRCPPREGKPRLSRSEAAQLLAEQHAAFETQLTEPRPGSTQIILQLEHASSTGSPFVSQATIDRAVRTLSARPEAAAAVAHLALEINRKLKEEWGDKKLRGDCAHHYRKHRGRQVQGGLLVALGICSLPFVVGVVPLILGTDMIAENNVRYSGPRASFVVYSMQKTLAAEKERLSPALVHAWIPPALAQANFNSVRNHHWRFALRCDVYADRGDYLRASAEDDEQTTLDKCAEGFATDASPTTPLDVVEADNVTPEATNSVQSLHMMPELTPDNQPEIEPVEAQKGEGTTNIAEIVAENTELPVVAQMLPLAPDDDAKKQT